MVTRDGLAFPDANCVLAKAYGLSADSMSIFLYSLAIFLKPAPGTHSGIYFTERALHLYEKIGKILL